MTLYQIIKCECGIKRVTHLENKSLDIIYNINSVAIAEQGNANELYL